MPIFEIFAGLNPDFDKKRRLEDNEYFDNDIIIENYNGSILKNKLLEVTTIKANEESIIDEINNLSGFNCKDHLADNLDPIIINNALNIINQIPPSILYHLRPENIYPSKYGTLILDWEFNDENNIVSFEVAKNSIGYFVEKDGKNIKQVDEITLNDDNIDHIVWTLQSEIIPFI